MSGFPTVPVPFGGGLDRATGVMSVQPAAFADLRNVHLSDGRAELRKGLERQLTIAGETHILGIFPIRSSGVGAIVAYSASTFKVRLWHVSGAGDVVTLVGELWTLTSTSSIPRVTAADSYDKLLVAHDEESIGVRQVTKVFDLTLGNITNLTGDLDRDGSANNIKFRWVRRWLQYIVAGGYGTDSDEDRPEVVRISTAGQPTVFDPDHFFIAGQRGDPVLDGAAAGDDFALRKESQSYRIVGHNPSTFRILPLDEQYGQASSRLGVSIAGTNYFWSLEGPRVSSGGPSQDLAFPLDLGGPDPDALAANLDLANGFATYVPVRKEVLFVFGQWVYTLHLKDAQPRWSYSQLASAVRGAGLLYQGTSTLPAFAATGGTITIDGLYTVHTFLANGDFTVTIGSRDVERLIVAGGGAGGGAAAAGTGGAGGGGAGGVKAIAARSIGVGTFPAVVGAGGTGGTDAGADGANSSFDGDTATGGGGGGGATTSDGRTGGSGGGGATDAAQGVGGAGTGGQGFAGGDGVLTFADGCGGGGGGAGQAGGIGGDGSPPSEGNGGNGVQSSISGTATYYGGGGGAGSTNDINGDNGGGLGGGGPGKNGGGNGSPGTANTGGGGGGAGEDATRSGGNGGSGIVIVRYLTA